MRFALLAFALLATLAPARSVQAPEVALTRFTVSEDTNGVLRRAADSCLAHLHAALVAKGIRVTRIAALEEGDLARARPARWAILGKFSWYGDRAMGELRLMDVATGEELRDYSNVEPDPLKLASLGDAVAGRVAVYVVENRVARPN